MSAFALLAGLGSERRRAVLLQLVYAPWFPERPKKGTFDPQRGFDIDGLMA